LSAAERYVFCAAPAVEDSAAQTTRTAVKIKTLGFFILFLIGIAFRLIVLVVSLGYSTIANLRRRADLRSAPIGALDSFG